MSLRRRASSLVFFAVAACGDDAETSTSGGGGSTAANGDDSSSASSDASGSGGASSTSTTSGGSTASSSASSSSGGGGRPGDGGAGGAGGGGGSGGSGGGAGGGGGGANNDVWIHQFVGLTDEFEQPAKIVSHIDGGVVVAGTFLGSLSNTGDEDLTAIDRDGFLAHLSPAGDVLWARALGMSSGGVQDVEVDGEGNLFVLGIFTGEATLGDWTIEGADNNQALVAKLGPDGTPIWAVAVGDPENPSQFPAGLGLGPGGEPTIVVQFQFDLTVGDVDMTGWGNSYVASLSPDDGALRWVSPIEGPGESSVHANDVTTRGGEIVVVGHFSDHLAAGDVELESTPLLDSPSADAFLVALDADTGVALDGKSWGGARYDTIWSAVPTADGGLVLGGTVEGNTSLAFGDPPISHTTSGIGLFVVALDVDNHVAWQHLYGDDAGLHWLSDVQLDPSGGVTFGGRFYPVQNGQTSSIDLGGGAFTTAPGGDVAFFARLDAAGEHQESWGSEGDHAWGGHSVFSDRLYGFAVATGSVTIAGEPISADVGGDLVVIGFPPPP